MYFRLLFTSFLTFLASFSATVAVAAYQDFCSASSVDIHIERASEVGERMGARAHAFLTRQNDMRKGKNEI